MATKTASVRARIEPSLKINVESILNSLGLTQTEAIILYYKQIELRNGLPFSVEIPNKITKKAIRESMTGENVEKFSSVEDLFDDLEN